MTHEENEIALVGHDEISARWVANLIAVQRAKDSM